MCLRTLPIRFSIFGVTNNLYRRLLEHREKKIEGFTKKYNCTRLVYYEDTDDVHASLTREKQRKAWKREWKVNLIKEMNPSWRDLSREILDFE